MVELIFVIVVLGIVASIGSEIIAQVYESYIVQRAQYRAGIKTELALNQIANRLHYAIPGTIGARANTGSAFVNITEITTTNDNVLQWVAYDGDSYEAITSSSDRKPGWSGFCDLDSSSSTLISTPGSNLDLADEIIKNLSNNSRTLADAAIYFPDGSDYNVSSGSDENITLSGGGVPSGGIIYERYKLAWTSYALSVEGGNLYLYYNFEPARGAALGSSKSMLLGNISTFKFKGSEGSMRIKICKEERISKDANITACKEKVVF
jgi:Tfp pilus assembly protein PilE